MRYPYPRQLKMKINPDRAVTGLANSLSFQKQCRPVRRSSDTFLRHCEEPTVKLSRSFADLLCVRDSCCVLNLSKSNFPSYGFVSIHSKLKNCSRSDDKINQDCEWKNQANAKASHLAASCNHPPAHLSSIVSSNKINIRSAMSTNFLRASVNVNNNFFFAKYVL